MNSAANSETESNRWQEPLKFLYVALSILTALGSVAAAGMEFLILLGVGWDSFPFDVLLIATALSTAGLIAGTFGLIDERRWADPLLLASSLYIPTALIGISVISPSFAPPSHGGLYFLPVCSYLFLHISEHGD